MKQDFEIFNLPEKNIPAQWFDGRLYKLYANERYFSRGAKRMHRVVFEHFFGPIKKGYEVHHIDHNTFNNRPENLQAVDGNAHNTYHGKLNLQDEAWKKKFHSAGIEAAKAWHASPEGIEWHRQHALKHGYGQREYGTQDCKNCGINFEKKSFIQEFCSNNCKTKDRRKRGVDNEKRSCVICGTEFEVNKYARNKTCSRSCGTTLGHLNSSE